jgi:hypothetical protein
MCVGIESCSKKNCLENERCVLYEPKHISPCEVRRGPKKRKKNTDIKINLCQQHIKFCSNARACEILGQCMLEHPSVLTNKNFMKELRKARELKAIAGIFVRYMAKVKKKPSKK